MYWFRISRQAAFITWAFFTCSGMVSRAFFGKGAVTRIQVNQRKEFSPLKENNRARLFSDTALQKI